MTEGASRHRPGPVSSGRPRALGPRALLLGGVLISSLAAFVSPVLDPDSWWHLRVGRWVLEHGRLPPHDLFTYTVPDHAWLDHEYLTEVLMSLVGDRYGLLGISLAFGLATWLGFLLVAAACRPVRRPYVIAGMGLFLAVLAGNPIWGPRPQMITFALASLELLWLRGFLDGSSRAIFWFPLVAAAWANLHGGWPVAFLFLLLAVGAEAWRRLTGSRGETTGVRRLPVLLAVAALSLVAVLANPRGAEILAYPFHTVASAAQQAVIVEWRSPDLQHLELWPFWAMLLLLAAGLALGRPGSFDVLLALAGAALALESVRHLPLFVAATTPVLVSCWSDAWQRLSVRPRRLSRPPPARLMTAATAAVLAVVTAGTVATVAQGLGRQEALIGRLFPVAAADWLALHPEVGTRMFNEYGWGGYLAYRFYPEPNRRVYVFGEALLMGDQQLWRYQRIQDVRPEWRRLLDDERVDYAVLRPGSALAQAVESQADWRLVYRDPTAVVYVRTG